MTDTVTVLSFSERPCILNHLWLWTTLKLKTKWQSLLSKICCCEWLVRQRFILAFHMLVAEQWCLQFSGIWLLTWGVRFSGLPITRGINMLWIVLFCHATITLCQLVIKQKYFFVYNNPSFKDYNEMLVVTFNFLLFSVVLLLIPILLSTGRKRLAGSTGCDWVSWNARTWRSSWATRA